MINKHKILFVSVNWCNRRGSPNIWKNKLKRRTSFYGRYWKWKLVTFIDMTWIARQIVIIESAKNATISHHFSESFGGWMTKASMPQRRGWGSGRWWGGWSVSVEITITWTVHQHRPCCVILHIEKIGVKLNICVIWFAKFRNRNKVIFSTRDIKNIMKIKNSIGCTKFCWTNMRYLQTCPITNVHFFRNIVFRVNMHVVQIGGHMMTGTGVKHPTRIHWIRSWCIVGHWRVAVLHNPRTIFGVVTNIGAILASWWVYVATRVVATSLVGKMSMSTRCVVLNWPGEWITTSIRWCRQ